MSSATRLTDLLIVGALGYALGYPLQRRPALGHDHEHSLPPPSRPCRPPRWPPSATGSPGAPSSPASPSGLVVQLILSILGLALGLATVDPDHPTARRRPRRLSIGAGDLVGRLRHRRGRRSAATRRASQRQAEPHHGRLSTASSPGPPRPWSWSSCCPRPWAASSRAPSARHRASSAGPATSSAARFRRPRRRSPPRCRRCAIRCPASRARSRPRPTVRIRRSSATPPRAPSRRR